MAKKFTIEKSESDVRSIETYLSFNTKRQVYEGSALVRGDDYDPGDGNHPQLRIFLLPSTIKETVNLTPEILSNKRYKWVTISWDPKKEYALTTQTLALGCAVYDEDGDVQGGAGYVQPVDLSPPTTITTPLADALEDSGLGMIVEFKPKYIPWKQKFLPKVMRALKSDMTGEEKGGDVTHFSLKHDPSTFIAVDVAGGDYVYDMGDTPIASLTVRWTEDVYFDQVDTFKATVAIDTHDGDAIATGTDLYFEIDYLAETL